MLLVETVHGEEEIRANIEELSDLIDHAETMSDLVEIEGMVGLMDLLNKDDYEQLALVLRQLASPWIDFVEKLCDRWEELEDFYSRNS